MVSERRGGPEAETIADGFNPKPLWQGKSECAKLIQSEAFSTEDGSFDFGDVHLSFGGEASGDFVEGVGFVAGEEVLDRAFAGVVGCQGQAPIIEMMMEVLQIFGGGEAAFVR